MGTRCRGQRVRKYAISQGALPSEHGMDSYPGSDHRRNSLSPIRASGQAHSLNKAPSISTHRLYRAGHTVPPAADSDFEFPILLREDGFRHMNFTKENCHD